MPISYTVTRCKPGQQLQTEYPRVQRFKRGECRTEDEVVVLFWGEFAGCYLAAPDQSLIGLDVGFVSANDADHWEPCSIAIEGL